LGYAQGLNTLGEIYNELDQVEKADSIFYESYNILKNKNEGIDLLLTLTNLCETRIKLNDHSSIGHYLSELIDINTRVKDEFTNVSIYNLRSKLFYKEGDFINALRYKREYLSGAKKLGSTSMIQVGLKELSDLYAASGNFKESFTYYKKYIEINDSLYNKEMSDKLSRFQAKYEAKEKDLEISEQAHQIEKQTYFSYFVVIFAVLIAIIAVVYINRYKVKNKANKKIEAQNVELEKLNNTKDKFFKIIAHDLRSPFSSIMGITQLLEEDFETLSKEDLKEYIFVLQNSSAKSVKLLENLLQWAMAQTNNIKIEKTELSLNSILDETIFLLNESAKQKNIQIINSVENETKIFADNLTIMTVFRNLINNAIKFTDKDGEIKIESISENENIVISIIDNGIGMSEEEVNSVFDVSVNSSKSGTANEQGTGLGLILCKEFIEKNDGIISIESEVGKGSIFNVKILRVSS